MSPKAVDSQSVDEDKPLSHLRLRSNWFMWIDITINFSFYFQELPFTLNFEDGRYIVKSSTKRKLIWAACHLCGAIVFWTEVAKMIGGIVRSHDPYQYFDLLYSMGWLIFDYPIMYIYLCRMDRVQEFLDELQGSKVFLTHSSKRTKTKTLLFAVAVAWYCFMTFAFFATRWGVTDWSFENYYKTLKSACELHFGISKSNEGQVWYPLALLVTFVLTAFHYNTILIRDMLGFAAVIMMKNVAVDLDRAIKSGTLSDPEVFELLRAHKKVTRKFNRVFGFLVAVYVVYASPYYSLHFIEIVETPGIVNLLSMPTYLIPLGLSCKWAIDIIILAKRRKRWLASKNRCLRLSRSSCSIMLDDIIWEKYGLGAYYTVNSFVTGQIITLITTVAIVRIQGSKRAAS